MSLSILLVTLFLVSRCLVFFFLTLSSVSILTTLQVALSNPDWRQAIQLETATLHLNGAWDLVPLPLGKHTVGCKWVYTVKFHLNDWLKAWLLAKEYTQAYGIDYDEMLSLEAKISSVQVMISLMANLDWTLYQFDVNNAFIHGDLLEELYME